MHLLWLALGWVLVSVEKAGSGSPAGEQIHRQRLRLAVLRATADQRRER